MAEERIQSCLAAILAADAVGRSRRMEMEFPMQGVDETPPGVAG